MIAQENDYWICPYCKSTDLVFSRVEPMGYYCGNCGKDADLLKEKPDDEILKELEQ
jgi:DNA-directed RNA polymerase subunit RPC12/RpoP